jgi:polyhydroxyalkanoate synthesis regulator phasin
MDETPQGLRDRIAHLRQLADSITDRQVIDAIAKMIEELEQRLRQLENPEP